MRFLTAKMTSVAVSFLGSTARLASAFCRIVILLLPVVLTPHGHPPLKFKLSYSSSLYRITPRFPCCTDLLVAFGAGRCGLLSVADLHPVDFPVHWYQRPGLLALSK